MANIEVNVGCFNVTKLEFAEKPNDNMHFISFNPTQKILTMKFPQSNIQRTGFVTLSEVIDIVTDYENCTAFEVSSFIDSKLL